MTSAACTKLSLLQYQVWGRKEEGRGNLFGDRENGRQRCHREGERDDACVYDTQVGRAMYFEVGRDDT